MVEMTPLSGLRPMVEMAQPASPACFSNEHRQSVAKLPDFHVNHARQNLPLDTGK